MKLFAVLLLVAALPMLSHGWGYEKEKKVRISDVKAITLHKNRQTKVTRETFGLKWKRKKGRKEDKLFFLFLFLFFLMTHPSHVVSENTCCTATKVCGWSLQQCRCDYSAVS